jgi:hypothetical protein
VSWDVFLNGRAQPNPPLPGFEKWDPREQETPPTLTAFSLMQIFFTAAGFNIPGVFLLPPGFLKKLGRNSNEGDQEIFF